MLELQLVDVVDYDDEISKKYIILLFCIDSNSKSYCIKVKNYEPFFYIDYNKDFTLDDYEEIEIGKKYKKSLDRMTTNIKVCKYKELQNYQKEKKKFLKLQFSSLQKFTQTKKTFDEKVSIRNKMVYVQRYESNITQFLRFFHEKNIELSNWISIDSNKIIEYTDENEKMSICNYEYEVDYKYVNKLDVNRIGPMKVLSFDIECTSLDGSFPQYSRDGDEIIQIGTTVETFGKGSEYDYNFIVSLKKCDKIDNCKVINCVDELDLIIKWCEEVKRVDPDIITGYNIWGFDYEYIYERALFLINKKNSDIIVDDILNISRIKTGTGNGYINSDAFLDKEKLYIVKSLSSSAMGDNILKYLNITGRVNIDLLKYVRDNKKLPMYKLDYVAEKFLGQNKNPVTPNDIFNWYNEGKIEKVTDIAKYCIQDCKLVNKLVNKLSVVENSIGMANTCWVPLNYIFTRGQGIKVHSLVLKECSELGYIVPHKNRGGDRGDFKGATVLTAKSGIHYYPVSALDFASLYPSSMISHNLCISSYIDENRLNEYIKKYNWPVDKYRKVEWNEDGVTKKYFYVQPDKNDDKIIEEDRAVLPQILLKLLNKRNQTKILMKKEKDNFKKAILDGLQLAYKVTANSVYGQLGSAVGPIGKVEVAACITTTGRQLLELAQDFILTHYHGSTAVYGDTDSVFIKFDLKRHKPDCLFHKDNMIKRKEKYHRIKKKICKEMKLSNENFLHSREATAVMKKTDFRLYKKCKCEEIPDLMSEEALKESIRLACEVDAIITELLPDHKIFENGKQIMGCQQLEYEKTYLPYILFTKKRYVGKLFEHKTDLEKDWYLDYKGIVLKRRDNAEIVKKFYKKCLMKIMEGNKVLALKYLEDSLTELLNNNKKKIYPIEDFVLSKTLKSIDKYKYDRKLLQSIMLLNKFILLKEELDKKNIDEDKIKLIFDNEPYDTKFTYNNSFKTCKHVSYNMSSGLKKINFKMSCKKCNGNIKNHYGINEYLNYLNDKYNTKSTKKEDRNLKELVKLKTYRFDKNNKIHNLFIQALESLERYNSNSTKENLRKMKIFLNKVSLDDIYKELLFCEIRKINMTHVILSNRMRERDPGSAPQVNERVQYCFIRVKGDERKYLQGDLVESPDYISKNNIDINYNYYIEKQLEKPLTQLFKYVDSDKSAQIFSKIKQMNANRRSGQISILNFLNKN